MGSSISERIHLADAHSSPVVPIVPESGRYLNSGQSSRAVQVIISQTGTGWYSSILPHSSSLLRIWSGAAYPTQLHLFDGSIKQALLPVQTEEL